ncbi:MAG TPA: head maturation protease, ClpP-related, partial [Planctomycetota bacterium]|nr:head maturation protease, ClpP-related [Planctomycetota bacterium]
SAGDARTHCSDHDGTFEEAAGEEEDRMRAGTREWFAIATTEDEAEIEIFDSIGGWFGLPVKEFKKAFDTVRKKKRIRLLLNSPGGDVTEGMAVYNLLGGVREKLTVEVLGVAASIASVIALAGKELIMGEGAYLMIHEPWSFAIGDSTEMRKVADVLDKMRGEIVKIYARNSNLTDEELLAAMAEETWYTAEEAVEAGFADSVLEHQAAAAAAFDWRQFKYQHIPPQIAAMATKTPPTTSNSALKGPENILSGGESMPNENANELDRLKAELAEKEGQIASLQAQNAQLKGQNELLLSENQEKAKELDALKRERMLEAKTACIEKALADGRITPKNRTRWEEAFDANPEATRVLLEAQEPVVALGETVGTGDGGGELDPEEKTLLDKMGISDEDVKKYGGTK